MNAWYQRLCAWSGIVMIALMLTGLLIAGFLPLPRPSMTSGELAGLVADDATRIRLGMLLISLGAVFLMPFVAETTVQMRRVEGRHSPLSWVQLCLGTLLVFEFILPLYVCMAATYRPDRSPEITQALFDLCWLMFVGLVATALLQFVAIAVVILGDGREQPVFPRWVGYLSIWVAVLVSPGGVVVFFKTGPLAWNGLFAFWIPLSAFGVWLGVMTWALLAAIGRQERDDDLAPAGATPSLEHPVRRLSPAAPGRASAASPPRS